MTPTLALVFYLVAIILFVLSAVPPVPYSSTLRGLGLAFFAAGHLAI